MRLPRPKYSTWYSVCALVLYFIYIFFLQFFLCCCCCCSFYSLCVYFGLCSNATSVLACVCQHARCCCCCCCESLSNGFWYVLWMCFTTDYLARSKGNILHSCIVARNNIMLLDMIKTYFFFVCCFESSTKNQQQQQKPENNTYFIDIEPSRHTDSQPCTSQCYLSIK